MLCNASKPDLQRAAEPVVLARTGYRARNCEMSEPELELVKGLSLSRSRNLKVQP